MLINGFARWLLYQALVALLRLLQLLRDLLTRWVVLWSTFRTSVQQQQ